MSKSIGIYDAPVAAVSAADLFNQVSAGIALVSGQQLNATGSDTLTISRKHATGVIIVLCIILFPIGLLALLARPTETITVVAKASDDGVKATATGNGDDAVISFLNELLRPSGS